MKGRNNYFQRAIHKTLSYHPDSDQTQVMAYNIRHTEVECTNMGHTADAVKILS